MAANAKAEISPLLPQYEPSASYSSTSVSVNGVPILDEEDSRIHIMVGDLLQFLKPYRTYLKSAYHLIFGNLLIGILLILLSKIYGWTGYRYIFPKSLPLNDWFFQFANLFLMVSYCISDLLLLRVCLFFACINFALFGWFGLGDISADCVLYNLALSLINLGFISIMAWEKRYIRFSPGWEEIYVNMFKPIGVSRHDFALFQKKGVIREKCRGSVLHHIDDNVTSMNILISGEVELLNSQGKLANTYSKYSIIEGIEWCQYNLDPEEKQFEHRFVAKTNVVFAKWSREMLLQIFRKHSSLKQSIRILLGLNAARTTYDLLNSLIDVPGEDLQNGEAQPRRSR